MRLAAAAFDLLQFADLQGQYVTIRGLPLVARLEFRAHHDRLVSLIGQADPSATLASLYDQDPEIRHLVNTCLQFFGIAPDRLSISMVQELLLARPDPEGGLRPGWLIELEFPAPPPGEAATGEPPTDAEILSALWSHVGDLPKAIELANDGRVPGRLLLDTLSAHVTATDEKAAKRQEFRKWAEVAKSRSGESSDWREIANQVLDQNRKPKP